ncbi:MAG: spore cortex-lytic enzyme [Oscillospiraceae bacterium]|jgi:N-acetylmuramoyl-L-alanine amidase|nr:MAG: spore cortex-lytic enzyme [Clostridiales bacterium]
MQKRSKRLCLALAVLLSVSMVLVALVPAVEAASYKKGSSGAVVTQIQTKLKSWGYYTGTVDGIYGSGTERAVRAFQQKNGLTVDGKAGDQTLAAMGLSAGGGNSSNSGGSGGASSSQVDLLARLISAEARGEPYSGQVAVGAVVLNRIKHPSFPNTLPGVIYQSGAFTCITDGQFNQPVAESAYRAARDALNGVDPSGGAIYYFNPSTATSSWIWSRPLITVIGKHRFCS